MASLVHVLHSFQGGSLSRDKLFVELDRILAAGRANESWLLATLDEENTRAPLPEDVLAQMRGRIEEAARTKQQEQASAGDARADVPEAADPDASRTRLATSLFGNKSAFSRSAGIAGSWPPGGAETAAVTAEQLGQEAIKGTGDVLNDRFVLEECVGAGGMSTVYKALDRRKLEAHDRNPYVAVKVLNLEFRAHPDSLIALQREAKKSQSLAHSNIVRVYDFDRDGSTVYMTMEYLAGKSLARVLRAPDFKGLEQSEAMWILDQVARALIFAHENCIVHADLKPANIILTADHKVKVIDFGIARAFRRPDDSDVEATRFDPGSLGALTPTYASPEMLEHREPDPRDDVYALACITYEMLTGRHPFGRMQATEARDGGLELKKRQLSRRQYKALKAALDFDRDKRTPTIRELVAALRPERAISYSVPVKALAKAAGIAGIVVVGYLLVVSGVIDYYGTDDTAADSGTGEKSMELASLQIDRAAGQTDDGPLPPAVTREDAIAVDRIDADTDLEPLAAATTETLETALLSEMPAAGADPAAAAGSLEERVAAKLGSLSCAAVNASVQRDTVKVRGYVSDQIDVDSLEKDLLALPGAGAVSFGLEKVDAGKCAVIDLLAPYWTPGREAGSGASIRVRGENNELTEGDALVVDITTPGYESYVNVDYFSLDGGVVHMLPGPRAPDNQAPANYTATIGDLGEWTVSKPFGTEMLTVIITPRPLFTAAREEYEKNADYVAALQQRLEQISSESGKDSVVVDLVMINTKPKSLLQQFLPGS